MHTRRFAAIVAVVSVLSIAPMFFLFPMHSISPLEVGTKAQLFIDHRFIETSENITLKMKGPALPDEDVLTFRNPWEEGQGFVGTVIEEEGIYKFWYENQAWDAKNKRSVGLFQCYATSRDGIHWEKPSLGIVEYEGSTENNIVMAGVSGGTVFIDPVARPEERYKYVGFARADPRWAGSKVEDER